MTGTVKDTKNTIFGHISDFFVSLDQTEDSFN